MKTLIVFLAIAGFLVGAPAITNAETGHGHEHAGGPKGGRLLEGMEPQAEFFVENDKTVTVTFYDDALKPVAATDQTVFVIAEAEGNKTVVEFEKKGDVLVSKVGLPEAPELNLVVRFKQTPEAKPMNFRFAYEDNVCDACKRAEYACICEH